MKLENIDIVMVGTTHPGNIGAAARAMNNMSISSLVLVEPKCPIGEIAYARASGANAVLDQRQNADSLQQAVGKCNLVVATSARKRSLAWPELSPRQLADKLGQLDANSRVALVFGREHSGLTNEELQHCHYLVNIPTNPDFSSLNVASAIQLICYEIFVRLQGDTADDVSNSEEIAATSEEMEGYFHHLEQVMTTTQFFDADNPGQLLQRLRRLYQRAEPSRNEINILRGILSSVEKYKTRMD